MADVNTYSNTQTATPDDVMCLGIIWPDTGDKLALFEMASAKRLNTLAGTELLKFDVAYSKGPSGHSVDALKGVGAVDSIVKAGQDLTNASAIVWACTSGSFIGGLDWARTQRQKLQSQIGKPVTTGTLALISSALRLGFEQIDILSPYPDDVSAIFSKCMTDAGFEVQSLHSLASPGATASSELPLEDACRRFTSEAGQALIIPDTAANTLDQIDRLEAVAGKPVLTVNQACLFECAVWAGAVDQIRKAPFFKQFDGCSTRRIL